MLILLDDCVSASMPWHYDRWVCYKTNPPPPSLQIQNGTPDLPSAGIIPGPDSIGYPYSNQSIMSKCGTHTHTDTHMHTRRQTHRDR